MKEPSDMAHGFGCEQLRSRVGRIETTAVESTTNKDKDTAGVVLGQVTELAHQLETLQVSFYSLCRCILGWNRWARLVTIWL